MKSGYKLSEVGVIPEDWEASSLRSICSKITDGTHDTPQPVRTGIPFLTAIHVKDNWIDYEDCLYLTKADHDINFSRCNPENGDVLMVNIGAGVATTAQVEVEYEFSLKNVALLKPNSRRLSGAYLNYCLAQIKIGITQSLLNGGAQPFLSLTQIGQIKVAVPSKQEQLAIATALSDVDALLAKLDQLIAKKRDLKQAAMQQLLTGQTRLPGFSGEWKMMPMKALDITYGGLAGKTKMDFGRGNARYIPFMNVMTDTVIDPNWLEQVDVSSDEMQNLAKNGDLFFNGSSETPEEVGYCSVLLEDIPNLYLNSFCFGFRFNADTRVNGLFFAYWFRSDEGRKVMSVLAQGATRYNISKSAFLKLGIPQPSADEQSAIATVLSDMDAELAAVEARRDKTRALKQGMMQELLTGRIRLV